MTSGREPIPKIKATAKPAKVSFFRLLIFYGPSVKKVLKHDHSSDSVSEPLENMTGTEEKFSPHKSFWEMETMGQEVFSGESDRLQ